MMRKSLSRAEAIEALIEEFTASGEFLEDMEAERYDLLDEYIESDEYDEQMGDARATILHEYQEGDEFKEDMAEAKGLMTSAYRDHLEALTNEALAGKAGVIIETKGASDVCV